MNDQASGCAACGGLVHRAYDVELYSPEHEDGSGGESHGRFAADEISIEQDGELLYAGPVSHLVAALIFTDRVLPELQSPAFRGEFQPKAVQALGAFLRSIGERCRKGGRR